MKVSIAMISYNHARFVGQAIESALAQRADFEWELVIGDDCSTDGTSEIVHQFARENPRRIRLVQSTERVGMNRNLERTLSLCQGEYIALLEGDDVWTSTSKLQRQADHLDNHPNQAGCFHNALAFYDDNSRQEWIYCSHDLPEEITTTELLRVNMIPTCAMMYRGNPAQIFPEWLLDLGIGDWPLHLIASQAGSIGFFDEVLASYRFHPGGAYSMRGPVYRHEQVLRMYAELTRYFGPAFERIIDAAAFEHWYALGVAAAREGDARRARNAAWHCITARPAKRELVRRVKIAIRTAPYWIPGVGSRAGAGARHPG